MVKKAVVACAGLGTRMLPATKVLPKELITIVDTPALQYILQELVESGITEIEIVISPQKEIIRRYLTPDAELEEILISQGRQEEIASLKNILQSAEINFVYQREPLGSAHAIYEARKFVGREPFVVCLGDDLTCSDVPVAKQLIDLFDKKGGAVVGAKEILTDEITSYGVIDALRSGDETVCRKIVEKPSLWQLPSRLASIGRYVMTEEFFFSYERADFVGRERGIPDVINLMSNKPVYVCKILGQRYDVGSKFGLAQAVVEYACRHRQIGKQFNEYLSKFAGEIKFAGN